MKWVKKLEVSNKYLKIESWFILKALIYFLYKILGCGLHRIQIVSGFDLEIDIVSKNIYPLILFFKTHSASQFKSITDIVCYDTPKVNFRFGIIYNLLSVNYSLRIRLISKVCEFWNIISLVSLYKSISWLEREIFDFFGVFFILNNDLRRILTDYGFKGFPLRKDFPVSGFIDVYYDDNQKKICYRKSELSQEYRNFNLREFWNI